LKFGQTVLQRYTIIPDFFENFKWIHTMAHTSDNEPRGIENATHNTFPKLTWLFKISYCFKIILFVTTDIYENVKIGRLKCIRTMTKQT
jgi:hypothetical protein